MRTGYIHIKIFLDGVILKDDMLISKLNLFSVDKRGRKNV